MPRLLTRISTAGNGFTSLSTMAVSDRSPAKLSSFAPGTVWRIFANASFTDFSARPLMMTRAPSRARPVAMARPMPLVEPETRASLPVNCRSIMQRSSHRPAQSQPLNAQDKLSNSPHLDRAFGHRDVFALRRSGFWFAHEGRDHRRRLKAGKQFAVLVEKLLPPADVVFQHIVELGLGGNLHDLLVEFMHGAEAFGIPRRHLAEHPAAEVFAKDFNHQIQVAAHDAHAPGEGGFGRQGGARLRRAQMPLGVFRKVRARRSLAPPGLAFQIRQRALENPRVIKRAASDAHARAAGFIEHLLRGRWRDDVAVADDGNGFHGFTNLV